MRDKLSRSPGGIAPQGQNVLDAAPSHIFQDLIDVAPTGPHAGEMGHGFDAHVVFNGGHQIQRFAARAAAGAPGNGNVVGIQRFQRSGRLQNKGPFLVGFRGEKLKRKGRGLFFPQFRDFSWSQSLSKSGMPSQHPGCFGNEGKFPL
jgi:hypothetical protein